MHTIGKVAALADAIRARMTEQDWAGQLFQYLTRVEGLKLCAQAFPKNGSSFPAAPVA